MTVNQNWTEKSISIKNLTLWDENARIPDYLQNGNDQELIEIFLEKYNLSAFAEEVVKDFDLPQLEKLVVWEHKGKSIVLEGNRRLATYKCLANPSLILDNTLQAKFKALGEKIGINESFKLEAVATSVKSEGIRFLDRKHYYSNNEIVWQQLERDHYIKRTRSGVSDDKLSQKEKESIFRANLAEEVHLVNLPEELKRKVLGAGFATTFYRIVGSPRARKKLKYERSMGDLKIKDENNFLNLLKVIIFNLVNKKTLNGGRLDSRTMNTEKEIEGYLDSISIADSKTVDELIAIDSKAQQEKAQSKKEKSRQGEKTTTTKSIFDDEWLGEPLFLAYPHKNRVKTLLKELKDITPRSKVNICASSLRLLLELAVYVYLKEKGGIQLLIKDRKDRWAVDAKKRKETGKSALPPLAGDWAPNFYEMLKYLSKEVALMDDPMERSALSHFINKDGQQAFLSELNLFMHNPDYNPKPENVIEIWDKLGKLIFKTILKKKK